MANTPHAFENGQTLVAELPTAFEPTDRIKQLVDYYLDAGLQAAWSYGIYEDPLVVKNRAYPIHPPSNPKGTVEIEKALAQYDLPQR